MEQSTLTQLIIMLQERREIGVTIKDSVTTLP